MKIFDLDSDYQSFIIGDEFIIPNVSYTLDTKISYFNPGNIMSFRPDYSKKYLTFTAIEDSIIGLTDYSETTPIINLQYSKNNGEFGIPFRWTVQDAA